MKLNRRNLFLASSATITLTLSAPTVQAADYYWDNNGNTTGFGTASGTWADPTTGNTTQGWSANTTGANDTLASVTTTTADALFFGANSTVSLANGTISISGNVAAGNMTFAAGNATGFGGAGNITFAGGNLTLSASISTLSVANTFRNVTIGSDIVAGNLTKAGAGTLILTGNNTYTGRTSISGGTLRLENLNAVANATEVRLSASNTILQLGTDVAFTTLPQLIGGYGGAANHTVVSDVATQGNPGVTQALGKANFGNTVFNFARGSKVGAGTTAGISFTELVFAGAGGTTTLNPTTANLNIIGGVTSEGTNTGAHTLVLGGTAAGNSIGGIISETAPRPAENVTKSGTSIWTLSGNNTYIGNTTVSGGALIFTKAAALPAYATANATRTVTIDGGTLAVQVGNTTVGWTAAEVDALVANATKTSGAFGIDTTLGDYTPALAITTTDFGPLGLTKLGTGNLTLSLPGNYTGATTIDNGTLAMTADQNLAGALNFGFNSGTLSNTGSLDMSAANATFGNLLVQTNSSANNTITIGSGKTLTLTASTVANVINVTTVGTNAVGGVSKLQVTGAGTLTVNDATRDINITNRAGSGSASAQMDLSGLGTFNATIANLFVGRPPSGVNGMTGDILTLAGNNTISASGNITMGGSNTSGATGTSRINLGQTNVLNAATFIIAGARSNAVMAFANTTNNSSVTLRGVGGGGNRTNIYLGDHGNSLGAFNATGGTNVSLGTINFTGGTVDARIDNLFVGYGGSTSGSNRGQGNGNFTMDGASSLVDINTLVIGRTINDNTAGNSTSSTGAFTVTNGTLQVSTAMTVANDIDTTSSSGIQGVAGTFTVAGGNATLGNSTSAVNLTLGNHVTAGNPGLANATVSLTGGTLTVFGNLTEGNLGAGTITSSLTLDGATLDMKGRSIGTSGALIDTLTFASGTLQNVAGINNGAGLTKTTANTLTLTGTNTYAGNTTVSEGTLALGANNTLPATPVSIGTATLDAATFDDTLGTLDAAGNATINLGLGANLAFAVSNGITWTGDLNITGTFVSGSSLQFGNSTGLTSTQLGLIKINNATGNYTLNAGGFLFAPSGGTPYATWSGGAGFYADANGDGVPNGMTWLLGGANTTSNGLALLPAPVVSGGNMTLSFKTPIVTAPAQLSFQYGINLVTWSALVAVPTANGTFANGTFTVTPANATTNNVTLTVSGNASLGGETLRPIQFQGKLIR